MPKSQVLRIMGTPASTSAKEGSEFLNYQLYSPTTYMVEDYYVHIVNGAVESYGRLGDFGRAKPMAQEINISLDQKP